MVIRPVCSLPGTPPCPAGWSPTSASVPRSPTTTSRGPASTMLRSRLCRTPRTGSSPLAPHTQARRSRTCTTPSPCLSTSSRPTATSTGWSSVCTGWSPLSAMRTYWPPCSRYEALTKAQATK